MNPWRLALAEWRTQRMAFLGVALLLALALSFALSVRLVERGLRAASVQAATRFDLLVGVAGSPTQLVLSALYLQPQALALLPPPVWDELAADPGVAQVIPLASGDAVGHYPVVGTSAALVGGGRWFALQQGRAFATGRDVAEAEAVVGAEVELPIGRTIRLQHGAPHQQPDTAADGGDDNSDADEDHHHHDRPLHIVGRLAPTGSPWDRAVLVPIEFLWSLHAGGAPIDAASAPMQPALRQVPVLVVQPRSVADAYRLRQHWRSGGLMAVFPAEVLAELFGTLGDARELIGLLASGTQALVLGAALLTVTVLLVTRRHAYAVLRAIGAPRGYLFALTWLMAMGTALWACVLALPLSWALSHLVSRLVQQRTGLTLPMQWQAADLWLPAGLLAASALGALLLGLRACRREVVGDLRQ